MGTYSTGPRRSSSYNTSSSPAGVIGIAVAAVSIWGLVCAARILLSCISLTLDVVLGVANDSVVQNVILSGVAGAICGLVIAMMHAFPRKPGSVGKAFVSALFSKGLAAHSLDGIFWSKTLLGALIGFLVGALTGSGGAISFFHPSDSVATVMSSNVFPLIGFLGGGFGGPGGADFWALLFLILVIVFLALLVGALSGIVVHLVLFGALGGATKGASKAWVLRVLSEPPSKTEVKQRPVLEGLVIGILTGTLVGIIEAIFTVLGIVRFYHPPTP